MGGDDLGSDDEYLAVVSGGRGDDDSSSGGGSGSDDDDDDDELQYLAKESSTNKPISKKRQRGDEPEVDDNHKKSKKKDQQQDVKTKKEHLRILQLAHDLEYSTPSEQATFLTRWINATDNDSSDNPTSTEKLKFVPNQFMVPSSTGGTQKGTMSHTSLGERLANTISKKRFKLWNKKHSPLVLIVCLSARRAVEILKELSSTNKSEYANGGCGYKFGIAKLFAKHLTVQQQCNMLQTTTYPIAIGTPHRLVTLLSTSKNGGTAEEGDDDNENTTNNNNNNDDETALSLKHTQLVILDCHKNTKNYTVCTLPDTSQHVKELITKYIQPELHRTTSKSEGGGDAAASEQNSKKQNKKNKKKKNKKKGNNNEIDNLRLAFF